MIASAPLALLLAFAAGLVLGLFYFGGLWWTVNRVATAGQPGLLMLVSMLLRSAVVLAGFWLVMGGQIDRLIACMVGFFVMRTILVRRLRPQPHAVGKVEGTGHELHELNE
jgi:F1F0 ATPase subunit 2